MYLIFHRRVWQARHTIPESLRPFFDGRAAFKRSTGETDEVRAKARAASFYVAWRGELDRAKAALRAEISVEEFQQQQANVLPSIWDITPISALPLVREDEAKILRSIRRAAGEPLADHIDSWIKSLRDDQPKTKHMKDADARAFAARFLTTEEATKVDIQRWIDEQLNAGAAVATIRRKLSNLRGYWHFLQSLGFVSEDLDPLARLRLPSGKATSIDVLPFTTIEVVRLAASARENGDQELTDAIVIAALTGARIEEIVTLEVAHVDLASGDVVLPGTKTDSAARRLPIHADLKSTLRRLMGNTENGYLFPDLSENKFGDRSNALGKRFGKLKSAAGFGRNKVFHSIRKTWRSQLHSAGVPAELADQMLGHLTGRLGVDVYAPDPDRSTKAKAIAKLKYPGLL